MSFCDVNYRFKKMGVNVFIGQNVYFRYPEEIEIGDNVIIDEFCYFTTSMLIEDFVHIGPFCSVIGGKESKLILHEFSGLSAGCRVICGSDDYLGEGLTNPTVPKKYRIKTKSTVVELNKHSVLGTSCVLHPGITIGEGTTVGSMSLITKNLDPWWVYMGVPAVKYKERKKENILRLEAQFKEDISGETNN